jgi:hypothetical protein
MREAFTDKENTISDATSLHRHAYRRFASIKRPCHLDAADARVTLQS